MDNALNELVARVDKELGSYAEPYLGRPEYGNLRKAVWVEEKDKGQFRWELYFDDLMESAHSDLKGSVHTIDLVYCPVSKNFIYSLYGDSLQDDIETVVTSDLEKAIADKKAEIDRIPQQIGTQPMVEKAIVNYLVFFLYNS
ncbi:MAG: hypothetical protein V1740_04570 [Candidatus Woesearchaeota archaeon]